MAKRGKHRGVYERVPGSGVWHIRFKHKGRIIRRRIGPYSLAVEEYNKARAKVAEGTYRHQARRKNPTLAEYMREYLDRNRHRLRSISTVERHARTWERTFGERMLREIDTRDVERFVGQRATQVSGASVNRELALLKAVYNAAIRDGLAFLNPVKPIKFFREQARVRFLSEEEETRLRKAIGEEGWPLVEFAIHTGMRQGEQFRLRWSDVDLGNRVLTVPLSKSGRSRHVYLNDRALGILQALPSRLKGAYVFPGLAPGRRTPQMWA
jgi:integrase